MGLIECKNCGSQISDKATKCPKCGADMIVNLENDEKNYHSQNYKGKSPIIESNSCTNTKTLTKQMNIFKIKKPVLGIMSCLLIVCLIYGAYSIFGAPEEFEFEITDDFVSRVEQYDNVCRFSEGIARVEKEDKLGCINTKGEEVIPCRYDGINGFSEGFARVEKNNKYGFINTKGEEVIPCRYDVANDFSEGLALAVMDGKFGFINTKGEEVIPCKYDYAENFSEGLAIVGKEGKLGYINTNAKEVVPCIYDYAIEFLEGFAAVMKDGKWGFINTKGKEIIPCRYDGVYRFSEGLAIVAKEGKLGYINTNAKEVVPCIYDYADVFTEGFAKVEKGGKWGFINTKGEEIIPCRYDYVMTNFSEGTAEVVKNDKWGLVDKNGNDTFGNTNDIVRNESKPQPIEQSSQVKSNTDYSNITTESSNSIESDDSKVVEEISSEEQAQIDKAYKILSKIEEIDEKIKKHMAELVKLEQKAQISPNDMMRAQFLKNNILMQYDNIMSWCKEDYELYQKYYSELYKEYYRKKQQVLEAFKNLRF